MEPTKKRRKVHPKLGDIRVEGEGTGHLLTHDLQTYWPSVPGADSFGPAAGVDCMVILLRLQWIRLKSIPLRGEADESALARYSWSVFDPFTHHKDGATEAARKEVIDALVGNLGEDFSFSQVCRSNMAIETLWEKYPYQHTYPWMITSEKDPLGRPGVSDRQLAKHGALRWNGVRPASLQERVNKVTSHRQVKSGTVWVYFQSPALLQVDFDPAEGCGHSLNHLFQFSATRWDVEEDKANGERCRMRKQGEQAYVLRAAVRRRGGPSGSDSIRVFAGDGTETLPPTPTGIEPPDWGFSAADAIPKGCQLSFFYTTSGVSPGVEISRWDGPRGLPRQLQLRLLDLFEKQAEQDRLDPEAACQYDSDRGVDGAVDAAMHDVEAEEEGSGKYQDVSGGEDEEMHDAMERKVDSDLDKDMQDVGEDDATNVEEGEVTEADKDKEMSGGEDAASESVSESDKALRAMFDFFQNAHQQGAGEPNTGPPRSTDERRMHGQAQRPSGVREPAGGSRTGRLDATQMMADFYGASRPRQAKTVSVWPNHTLQCQ